MVLYKKIKLQCFSLLKDYALEFSNSFKQNTNGAIYHNFPAELKTILDLETEKIGLGKSGTPLYFYKISSLMDYRSTHVDASIINNKINICNLSLVLPIKGCKNTKQFWYNGNYELQVVSENNVEYSKLNWKDSPYLVDFVEIFDSPTLCNVSIPHGIVTNGIEQRVTCTLRFDKNPSIDNFLHLNA